HNNCNFNFKLFNYLYSDLKMYSIEEIAYMSYVNEKTVRRFKNKTEKIIEILIKKDDRYQLLNNVFEKHQNM
ncbi:MAG: hypothetical protein K2I77_03105, partial [Anaeroplasmataceae bacterium]|nr:hypothetical protein [Anaeroplasmataceae bacterium]